jgi:hypothetical protein
VIDRGRSRGGGMPQRREGASSRRQHKNHRLSPNHRLPCERRDPVQRSRELTCPTSIQRDPRYISRYARKVLGRRRKGRRNPPTTVFPVNAGTPYNEGTYSVRIQNSYHNTTGSQIHFSLRSKSSGKTKERKTESPNHRLSCERRNPVQRSH